MWIRGGFALTLLIFAAIAVFAYLGMSSYLSNMRSVALSNNIHIQLDDLVSSLKDIQRGARGYIITGDTSFLAPFRAGTSNLWPKLIELGNDAEPAVKNAGELAIIRSFSENLISATETEVNFVRAGKVDSARQAARRGEPNRVMERIEDIVLIMEEKQAAMLAKRQADAESDFNQVLLFLQLGTAFNFALIIGMFVFMNRQLRNGRSVADTLKASEQRLQTVIDSVQEGITFSDTEGKFKVFNQRMTEITGYTMEEANEAGDFTFLLYPDSSDPRKVLDGVRGVIDQGGQHVSETTITTKSGGTRLLRVASQMVGRDASRMFLTTYVDITEQRALEETLRESEQKFRLVFENAQDGINIFEETADHTKRRLVECNPRYAELAGRSREELLEAGITSTMTVSLSGENVEAIEDGTAFSGSFSWIRPDRRENFIEYTAMPIKMRGKKFTIGIDRDVTDARKAEELVRESQRRYQQLFEASPIPIIIYDAATLAILEVNPATIEHYGYSRAELLAMTVMDIRPVEDVSGFLAHIGAEAHKEERTFTTRHRRKDGSIMRVEINSHAVDWKDHSARLVLVHDITELLDIETELKVQKAHFERLFESAPEGIALLDGRGDVHDVNRAFTHMFGFSKEEVVGSDIIELTIPHEGREEARSALEAVMDGVSLHLEAGRLRRDGQPIDVSIIAVPVDNGRGTNMAYVLYRDITQKKRGDMEREDLIQQLQKALVDVKTLGGLLPICAWCKKIRDDQGYYHQIETFIAKHSEAKFTHGICPDCRGKFDRDAAVEARETRKVPG
jgi:PAS domain S-box-containing protein